jgi:hypothetical protein
MRDSHLSDEQLLEASRALLAECAATAASDADAAFPEESLDRQRARILHRIEQDGRPGRLISFPAALCLPAGLDGLPAKPHERAHAAPPAQALRTRTTARWVAGAAAAGLVIGVFAGQMVQGLRGFTYAPAPAAAVQPARQPAPASASLRAVATTMSDEELLLRVDSVTDRSGGSALGPLDQMTPRVWEVAAR